MIVNVGEVGEIPPGVGVDAPLGADPEMGNRSETVTPEGGPNGRKLRWASRCTGGEVRGVVDSNGDWVYWENGVPTGVVVTEPPRPDAEALIGMEAPAWCDEPDGVRVRGEGA